MTGAADTGQPDDGRKSAVDKRQAPTEGDYADRSSDGSYAFRYADRNQFHSAAASKDNVVSGRYVPINVRRRYIVQSAFGIFVRFSYACALLLCDYTSYEQVFMRIVCAHV